MELNEILAKIAELKNSVSELANECYLLRSRNNNPHTIAVADYLNYELTGIACHLSDLEETKQEEDTTPPDEDSTDDADTIEDWWCDLDLSDKCEIANLPYPTHDSGRGEEFCEAEDRCDKWWDSRTNEQKREIYEENLAWWDKE